MRTILILTIAFVVMNSCDKDKKQFNLDAGIEITVFDELGNDLLNPVNPNAFIESQVKIFYLVDGVKQEVYYSNYEHPRNFSFFEKEGVYRMGLSPNGYEREEFPVTYIKWNESDMDTLKCSFLRTDNSVICTKVWYNNILMWDDYSNCRCIQIVK